MSRRLSAGLGYRGKLKKKVDGSGDLGGSITRRLKAGKTVAMKDGFRTRYEGIDLIVFHTGRRPGKGSKGNYGGQAPRPIIGLSPKDEVRFAKLVGEAIEKRGKKLGIFK